MILHLRGRRRSMMAARFLCTNENSQMLSVFSLPTHKTHDDNLLKARRKIVLLFTRFPLLLKRKLRFRDVRKTIDIDILTVRQIIFSSP